MAITIDGENLRIILESGITEVDVEVDIYSRWKDWAKTPGNAKYPLAFLSEGGAPAVGALRQGAYIRLRNDFGWRFRPPEEDITILFTGNLIPADDTLPMLVPTLGAFTAGVFGIQPITQIAETGTSGLTGAESTQLFALGTPPENADAIWDEELIGATHNILNSAGRRLRVIQESGGYAGMIWVDTINGVNPPTPEPFEDGTDTNPVNNMADANTLAAAVGISQFHIASGSSIVLDAAQVNQTFRGSNWDLDLNGMDISGSTFRGAHVSGAAGGTGEDQHFYDCEINGVSHLANTHLSRCGIVGTQTILEAGDIFFDNCFSEIAGIGSWTFDFGNLVGDVNLNVRHYSGGITLENMGNTGTDHASIEGMGQIIEGTCAGGIVAVRGNFTMSGVTNLTFEDDARYDKSQVSSAVWDYIVENGKTAVEFIRILKAAAAGKLSGAGTSNVKIRDDADAKDRIDATVTTEGNRTDVTTDGS